MFSRLWLVAERLLVYPIIINIGLHHSSVRGHWDSSVKAKAFLVSRWLQFGIFIFGKLGWEVGTYCWVFHFWDLGWKVGTYTFFINISVRSIRNNSFFFLGTMG